MRLLPGNYKDQINSVLAEAEKWGVVDRIWARDPSLWKEDPLQQKVIRNSLGWLTVAREMIRATGELRNFAEEIRSEGFSHVMVCGMGGSSLCPEVWRRTYHRSKDHPELLVLDSTDPDVLA